MTSLVISDTVRVGLVWSLSGVEYAVNVLHYLVPSGQIVSNATATAIAGIIGNAFAATTLDNYIHTSVTLARVTARDLRTANLPEHSGVLAIAGQDNTTILPLQTALCATLRTAMAGRSYRGRYYQGGFGEIANLAGGICDILAAAQLEVFLTNISSPVVQTHQWVLGVMSPLLGETNPVTAIDVRDVVWDSQRRRARPGI